MLTQRDLGQRLKSAREAIGLTQQQVADQVELTRVAISQIESGHRTISSIELMHLSRLYGRDMASFLEEKPVEKDALAVLFRAHPDLLQNHIFYKSLRDAHELLREYGNLQKLLDLDQERNLPPVYDYGEPKNVWEAIQMGEQAAEAERSRLRLGINPIRDMAELVESQGIPVIEIRLDDQVSGIFMVEAEIQLCIFINEVHLDRAKARVAFTIAHEYGHILLDRDKVSAISKISNDRDLFEVRANAFAAAFLMPEEGVSQFLKNIDKGASTSRERLLAYTEQPDPDPLVGHYRRLASSQLITLYDVVKFCAYFGISFEAALYRLRNTKFLSEELFDQLFQEKKKARRIARRLNIEKKEREHPFSNFALNFTGMAIEAHRRDKITRSKLINLAKRVKFDDVIDEVLHCMGIKNDAEEDVHLPE
jgi:Zn-dependent peptidase ImmA (M78 family)/DNA-binding XRE family transcriptional regulator